MNLSQINLSSRDRRTLVTGATVMGFLVLVGRVIPAWRGWQDGARTTAARANDKLAQEEAVLYAERAIRDSLTTRRHRLDSLASTWLDGDSPAAGGAALAALVSSAATRAQVSVGTLNISADSLRDEEFVKVRVRGLVSGDIRGVAILLATIERGPARLAVRALSIQSTDAATTSTHPELLHADFVVEGVWRRPKWVTTP